MKKYFLFDLDGTLTDPGIGITNSAAHALRHFGIETASREELYPYIGPPLDFSFSKYHGIAKEDLNHAIELFREYFAKNGIFENEAYEGIENLLKKLKGEGASLLLATSKPEKFAVKILEHFGLYKYFDFIGGSPLEGAGSEKAEVIRSVMRHVPDISEENAVMIGDREYDILGAHECGLSAVGVLYGYGSETELKNAGADFIAGDIKELEELLLSI